MSRDSSNNRRAAGITGESEECWSVVPGTVEECTSAAQWSVSVGGALN